MRGLTEHLIAYALGRPFGFSDEAMADSVIERAAASGFTLKELIRSLILHPSFQTK